MSKCRSSAIPLYPVKTTRLANTAMLIVIDAINKLIKKPFNCSNIPWFIAHCNLLVRFIRCFALLLVSLQTVAAAAQDLVWLWIFTWIITTVVTLSQHPGPGPGTGASCGCWSWAHHHHHHQTSIIIKILRRGRVQDRTLMSWYLSNTHLTAQNGMPRPRVIYLYKTSWH